MQDIKFKHINVNLNPRPTELKAFADTYRERLQYLGAIAKEKRHAASLIVNLYNPNICGADMNGLAYYCRGESCETLKDGAFDLVLICAYVESHEIYGTEFVEGLIKQWGFREKQ